MLILEINRWHFEIRTTKDKVEYLGAFPNGET
jgi:hypothetical protein